MTKILLIRHGKSVANESGLFGGITDYPLSDNGHEQAKKLAEKLKMMNIDAIYSSPLTRAIDTIKSTSEMLNIEIKIEDDLREIYVGTWEDKIVKELEEKYTELTDRIRETEYYTGIENQEETIDVAKRMLKIITRIARENDGKTVAIASHVVAIRAFLCTIMGIPFEQTQAKIGSIHNTNITIINYDNTTGIFNVVQLKDYKEN